MKRDVKTSFGQDTEAIAAGTERPNVQTPKWKLPKCDRSNANQRTWLVRVPIGGMVIATVSPEARVKPSGGTMPVPVIR